MSPGRKSDSGTIGGFLALVVVIGVLVAIGVVTGGRGSGPSGEPTCDGKPMSPGDNCISFGNPNLGGTYEEMKQKAPGNLRGDRVASVISFALAGLVLVGGLASWRRGRRDDAVRIDVLGPTTTEAMLGGTADADLGAPVESAREDTTFRRATGKLSLTATSAAWCSTPRRVRSLSRTATSVSTASTTPP